MKGQRISDLKFNELEEILIESYGRLGMDLSYGDERLKKMCTQLFDYQKHVLANSIIGMFEMYANGKIKCPDLKVTVSGWFFKEIKDGFFALAEQKKKKEAEDAEAEFHRNRGKVEYTRFMMYCDTYRKWPREIDWLLILKFLVEEKDWKLYDGFYNEPMEIQLKTARVHIKSFAKEFFARREQKLAAEAAQKQLAA